MPAVLIAFLFIINVINIINAHLFFIEDNWKDALVCSFGAVVGTAIYTALILDNV